MNVRRYEPKDFEQIKAWGEQWGAEYDEAQFPQVGFIVDGVAAYFLYSTDSVCCWLENMVTNREAEKEERKRALDLIVDAILSEARSLGFKVAYATTKNISAAKRAKTLGAHIATNHLLITKLLDENTHLQ